MTREDVICMAREVGIIFPHYTVVGSEDNLLEDFAALVAAAERKACADVVEQAGIEGHGTLAAAAMIRARGEE